MGQEGNARRDLHKRVAMQKAAQKVSMRKRRRADSVDRTCKTQTTVASRPTLPVFIEQPDNDLDQEVDIDILDDDNKDDDTYTEPEEHHSDVSSVTADRQSQIIVSSSVSALRSVSQHILSDSSPVRAAKSRSKARAFVYTEAFAGATGQRPKRKELRSLLLRIVKSMYKKDAYSLFSSPVDTRQMPHYRNIIATPIDLSVIKFKVEHDLYTSLDDFQRDFHILVTNCNLFNPPTSIYVREMHKLSAFVYAWLDREYSNEFYITTKKNSAPTRFRQALKGNAPKWQTPNTLAETTTSDLSFLDISNHYTISDYQSNIESAPETESDKEEEEEEEEQKQQLTATQPLPSQYHNIPLLMPRKNTASLSTNRAKTNAANGRLRPQPAKFIDYGSFPYAHASPTSSNHTIDKDLLRLVYGDEKGRAYIQSLLSFTSNMPEIVQAYVRRKCSDLTNGGFDVHRTVNNICALHPELLMRAANPRDPV